MKKLFNNRQSTHQEIAEIIKFLGPQYPGFEELKPVEKLRLAMQFHNCERGRLWRGKMFIDILAHLIPFILALATIVLALKK